MHTSHLCLLVPYGKNEFFLPLTEADILLRRLEQHGTEVNSPSRRVYTVYPTLLVRQADRWRLQSSTSLCMCGYVAVLSELYQCVILRHVPLGVRWSSMES